MDQSRRHAGEFYLELDNISSKLDFVWELIVPIIHI